MRKEDKTELWFVASFIIVFTAAIMFPLNEPTTLTERLAIPLVVGIGGSLYFLLLKISSK